MKLNRSRAVSIAACALIAMGYSRPALACAACFGQSDSAMARGMNMGIFALLFVILGVLVAISTFFVFVARRATKFSHAALQPEFSHSSTQA